MHACRLGRSRLLAVHIVRLVSSQDQSDSCTGRVEGSSCSRTEVHALCLSLCLCFLARLQSASACIADGLGSFPLRLCMLILVPCTGYRNIFDDFKMVPHVDRLWAMDHHVLYYTVKSAEQIIIYCLFTSRLYNLA
jgi:hypothetical protein